MSGLGIALDWVGAWGTWMVIVISDKVNRERVLRERNRLWLIERWYHADHVGVDELDRFSPTPLDVEAFNAQWDSRQNILRSVS